MSNMSEQKIIQIGLTALVDAWPMIKTWSTLPNWTLYEIGLARIESIKKGIIYLPREIEERVIKRLKVNYRLKIESSIKHYIANNISIDNSLYCQYGVVDSILLSY